MSIGPKTKILTRSKMLCVSYLFLHILHIYIIIIRSQFDHQNNLSNNNKCGKLSKAKPNENFTNAFQK